MPSGKPIDWDKYIPLLRQHLPKMTIKQWREQYAPHIAQKTVANKAKELKIDRIIEFSSPSRSKKISDALKKDDPEMITKLREWRDDYSLKQLAKMLNTNTRLISSLVKRHNIVLSEKGKNRAKEAVLNGLIKGRMSGSTIESRQRKSLAMSKRQSRGLKTYRSSTLDTKKGGTIITKSSYETRYCHILDNDPNVKSYSYESIRLQYYWKKLKRFYVPDFLVEYVDGTFCIIEVKPSKLLDDARNKAKFKAANEHILPFRIVTEIDLVSLEA